MEGKPRDVDKPLRDVPSALLTSYCNPSALPKPTFEFSEDGSERARFGSLTVPLEILGAYECARRYLVAGDNGRQLLAQVENHDLPVVLNRDTMNALKFEWEPRPGEPEIVVQWDPNAALAHSAGGFYPPSLVLAHEFGHAIRTYRNAEGGVFPIAALLVPIPSSTNVDERNVIRGTEVPIAVEHGHRHLRDAHSGGGVLYQVAQADTSQPLYPDDRQQFVESAPYLRHITQEMDRRNLDPENVSVKAVTSAIPSLTQCGNSPIAQWSDAQLIAARDVVTIRVSRRLENNRLLRDAEAQRHSAGQVGAETAPSSWNHLPVPGSKEATQLLLEEARRVESILARQNGIPPV